MSTLDATRGTAQPMNMVKKDFSNSRYRLFPYAALALLSAGMCAAGPGADGHTHAVWREDFDSLDGWEPLTFPKIERHTRYAVTNLDGRTVLKAAADASASGLVCTNAFNPYDTPVLRWRWRVEQVLAKGDATRKDGDDYPLRVYILFAYEPDRASLGMRAKYAIARGLYGEYPPHASLNYIWANRRHARRILTSPYTDRSRMIVVRAGPHRTGEWVEETADILADYRAAFGEDPPRSARLAVMSDTDNTGGHAVAFVDRIERRASPRGETGP